MIFEMGKNLPESTSRMFSQGLRIYQNNLLMTAARSLSLSYPVLEKLLSAQTMVAVAREFLKVSRPDAGDWAEWGEQLPDWLATTALAEESPFLPDVARLEWLMHHASRSAPADFHSSSLSMLSGESLEQARIALAPSVGVLASSYPVDAIWQAHQPQEGAFELDTVALEEALGQGAPARYLLVYQHNQVAHMKSLSRQEHAWFADLNQGYTVAELIARHPEFELITWLPRAIQGDLVEDLY